MTNKEALKAIKSLYREVEAHGDDLISFVGSAVTVDGVSLNVWAGHGYAAIGVLEDVKRHILASSRDCADQDTEQ